MNIESLKERLVKERGVEEVRLPDDEIVRLKRLSAADGLALSKHLQSMGYGKDGGPEDTPERLVALNAFVLSKVIVDDKGTTTLDSDEGRTLLEQLSFDTLTKLGRKALRLAGLDTSGDDPTKKNSAPTSSSPTVSAEPSSKVDTGAQPSS